MRFADFRYLMKTGALTLSAVLASTVGGHAEDRDDRDGATALMQRVSQAYAQSTRGVVGVRSESLLTIKAPVVGRKIADEGWFVFVDGVLAGSSHTRDPRQPPLHDPYRADYLAEYDYEFSACSECAPGTVEVNFKSRLTDVEHASGRLIIDAATARIVAETEVPYKLPWPTQSGSLDVTWGSVAGGWLPQTISGSFIGRIGPFVGHAYYHQTLLGYSRFASVDEATKALESPGSS